MEGIAEIIIQINPDKISWLISKAPEPGGMKSGNNKYKLRWNESSNTRFASVGIRLLPV